MKIIDEKGRFFKKINILDLLLILFFLCLAPALYLGFKLANNAPVTDSVDKEFIEIEAYTKIVKLNPEILELISVGDKEFDKNMQVIGEIISLGQSTPYKHEYDLGGNQKIDKEDHTLKQIKAKLKLKAEIIEARLYYKDREIKINSYLNFKTGEYNCVAIPIEEEKKGKWISLHVKFARTLPEIAEVIQKGDTEKDTSGKTIAKISRITGSKPALVTTIHGDNFITLKHPVEKDINAILEVLCEQKEGVYHFKNGIIKMGSDIIFTTDLYTISGKILGMKVK